MSVNSKNHMESNLFNSGSGHFYMWSVIRYGSDCNVGNMQLLRHSTSEPSVLPQESCEETLTEKLKVALALTS